jgi:hypothetical protein
MKTLLRGRIRSLAAVAIVALTLAACTSSTRTATELEKYDDYAYADVATFNRPYQDTYQAAIASLEEMGFTITLTDETSGAIEAESGTRALRPEETGVVVVEEESGGPGFFEVLVRVVVAVLVFITGGDMDDYSDAVDQHPEPAPQTFHVYIMALAVQSEEPGQTTVAVGASRDDYEDADLVRSVVLENKYLNHSLFDKIEEYLKSFENSLPPSEVQ